MEDVFGGTYEDIYRNTTIRSAQWEQALSYYNYIVMNAKIKHPDAQVVVTGHSLGGALAQAVGAHIGGECQVFAFNPAEVPWTALQAEGLVRQDHYFTQYGGNSHIIRTENDPVSGIVTAVTNSNHIGSIVNLPPYQSGRIRRAAVRTI